MKDSFVDANLIAVLCDFKDRSGLLAVSSCKLFTTLIILHFLVNYITLKVWIATDIIIIKPPRDKTNKMTVRPAKTQISLGIRPVWSGCALGFKLASCGQRRLIRLGGCPGWSESSLGAQPHCWVCHKAAHILFIHIIGKVLKRSSELIKGT